MKSRSYGWPTGISPWRRNSSRINSSASHITHNSLTRCLNNLSQLADHILANSRLTHPHCQTLSYLCIQAHSLAVSIISHTIILASSLTRCFNNLSQLADHIFANSRLTHPHCQTLFLIYVLKLTHSLFQ